ncbi:MAG: HAD-IB family hydrolase [Propionibacteriales bacterium]|nr:HAD-IB family hydrolase [Propionibacteriales bacterium]
MSPRSAAFFDLDKTIIARSSALAFSKPFFEGGLLTRRAVLRSAYANFMFGLNGADHDQLEKMRQQMTSLIAGWDVEVVRDAVRRTLRDVIDPIVYAEAVDLVQHHQRAGRDVVIVSASGSEVVGPVGELLGVHDVIATRLVERDGRYTGEVEFYAYGPHKATAMRRLAEERGYDLDACFAYSDSETDVPMLEAVGHPFAVNPDKALRRIAAERDWPVLVFDRPVALRSRLGLHSTTGRAFWALVGAGAAAGTALLVQRGRRTRRSTGRRILVRS